MRKIVVITGCIIICALSSFNERGITVNTPGAGSGDAVSEEVSGQIHPLWGDMSKLTPPPPLQGNPLIITDLERSPDNPAGPARPDEGFLYTGPDGQTFHGRWVTITPSGKYTIAPGGKVWRVTINGNGADVWINGNRDSQGNPRNLDFCLRVQNCRTARLSALKAFINDIRTVNGYHPDGGEGETRLIGFTNFPDNFTIFIEGCDIDMNEGGVKPGYRTDAISSSSLASLQKGGTVVIQNSRVMNISSDYDGKYDDGTTGPNGGEITHCDLWHFQGNSHVRWVLVENFEASTKFQGFQMNYKSAMLQGSPLPEHPLHVSFYRMRFFEKQNANNKYGKYLYIGGTGSDLTEYQNAPSTEFEQVYLSKKNSYPFTPNGIISATNPDRSLVYNSTYINARSNIIRKNGTIQPGMVNADENGVVSTLFYYQTFGTGLFPVVTFVPDSAVGHNYQHIWDQDGNVLASYTGSKVNTRNMQVFPNPSSRGIFRIRTSEGTGLLNYEVYNSIGILVKTGTFTGSENQLDLQGNPEGIYILKTGGENVTVRRLLFY